MEKSNAAQKEWELAAKSYPRVIILAAGQGTRLSAMYDGLPKCLFPFGNEMLLQRTLRQFEELGFRNVTVVVGYRGEDVAGAAKSAFPNVFIVHNKDYQTDRSILSVLLGLGGDDSPALVVEGDVVFSESGALALRDAVTGSRSVLFANGVFNRNQYGGILAADERGEITDIRYAEYSDELAGYYKNLGVAYIGEDEMPRFMRLLEERAAIDTDEHYFFLWAANRDRLPALLGNVTEQGGASFNTPEEYRWAVAVMAEAESRAVAPPVELLAVMDLRHIEDYDRRRAAWLAEKIRAEGVWTMPVCVSKEFNLVMDGQHRLEAAKLLGLGKIPAVKFAYREVEIWSLRPELSVTHDSLFETVGAGGMYPYKTVKHKFPAVIPECSHNIGYLV